MKFTNKKTLANNPEIHHNDQPEYSTYKTQIMNTLFPNIHRNTKLTGTKYQHFTYNTNSQKPHSALVFIIFNCYSPTPSMHKNTNIYIDHLFTFSNYSHTIIILL